jgi:7-cyano-7-deazaguanine synthase
LKITMLLSGGLDSTTLLAHLTAGGMEVACLSFDYGQTHRRELDAAAHFAGVYNAPHSILRLPGVFSGSALTHDAEMPDGHYTDESMRVTVVPNRNMVMLSIAASVAIQNDSDGVAYAAHAGDRGTYLDCRPVFISAMREALSLCHWEPPMLLAPFENWSKRDIYLEAVRLGVDVGRTWSCYAGGAAPCGVCGTCSARSEAMKEAA